MLASLWLEPRAGSMKENVAPEDQGRKIISGVAFANACSKGSPKYGDWSGFRDKVRLTKKAGNVEARVVSKCRTFVH